jgi:two-component system, NarL family, sensor histidine kinase DesK
MIYCSGASLSTMHNLKNANKCVDPHRSKSWVWLVFSIYYFIPMYYVQYSTLEIAIQLLAYFTFIGLYLWAFKLPRAKGWIPISLITLIAVSISPLTVGSSTFFSFLGVLIGFTYSTRTLLILLGGYVAIILLFQFYLYENYPFQFFGLPALMGLVTTSIVGYMEKFREENRIQSLKSSQEIQQLAVIAERERIARDLHDILGHTLSSIALKAELAEKLLLQEKNTEAKEHIRDLHQIARNSLSLVRQTVSGYKHRGLTGEVIDLCDKLRQQGFIVNLRGDIPNLTPRAETAVILALTELTTNLLRHSNASHCEIHFLNDDKNINICVQDNGKVKQIEQGNGLHGIQERLAAIAGELLIDISKGCRFDIRLPKSELIQVTQ